MTNIRPKSAGITQFDELLTAERTPVIELNSSYGTSVLRDIETTAGTGSISTSSTGEILLSTGATASSTSKLDAAEVGRYIPGYSAEFGVGVRIPTLPTGNQEARWGGEADGGNEGFYFGYDSTGFYVARKRNGTEVNKVYQVSWNIDKLDGSGKSGIQSIDLTKGIICQVKFTWYGYGQILFGILASVNNEQRFIEVHEIKNQDFTGTSIQSPNLKVFAEVKNNADSSDLQMYVGGRQYSVVGNYIPKYRFTGDFRASTSTSTTTKPLISFKRKSGFGDRSIKIERYNLIVQTEPLIIQIILDGTLAGGTTTFSTPTDHTASETALESNTGADTISGGTVIWTGLAAAGAGTNRLPSSANIEIDIPNGSTISLCAKTLSGTGSAISLFKMREEW